ncbi:hypothetical protein JKP88DRAFT_315192 [Tribonema minus]|uniref:Uncharacterized protein n=1 Tax=Tribonema minus TaxID=303371 RepID=A0A836CFD1_9STRA|nr:hypothetical protein JKP88DRAFT_315192 [Tribonema minus]
MNMFRTMCVLALAASAWAVAAGTVVHQELIIGIDDRGNPLQAAAEQLSAALRDAPLIIEVLVGEAELALGANLIASVHTHAAAQQHSSAYATAEQHGVATLALLSAETNRCGELARLLNLSTDTSYREHSTESTSGGPDDAAAVEPSQLPARHVCAWLRDAGGDAPLAAAAAAAPLRILSALLSRTPAAVLLTDAAAAFAAPPLSLLAAPAAAAAAQGVLMVPAVSVNVPPGRCAPPALLVPGGSAQQRTAAAWLFSTWPQAWTAVSRGGDEWAAFPERAADAGVAWGLLLRTAAAQGHAHLSLHASAAAAAHIAAPAASSAESRAPTMPAATAAAAAAQAALPGGSQAAAAATAAAAAAAAVLVIAPALDGAAALVPRAREAYLRREGLWRLRGQGSDSNGRAHVLRSALKHHAALAAGAAVCEAAEARGLFGRDGVFVLREGEGGAVEAAAGGSSGSGSSGGAASHRATVTVDVHDCEGGEGAAAAAAAATAAAAAAQQCVVRVRMEVPARQVAAVRGPVHFQLHMALGVAGFLSLTGAAALTKLHPAAAAPTAAAPAVAAAAAIAAAMEPYAVDLDVYLGSAAPLFVRGPSILVLELFSQAAAAAAAPFSGAIVCRRASPPPPCVDCDAVTVSDDGGGGAGGHTGGQGEGELGLTEEQARAQGRYIPYEEDLARGRGTKKRAVKAQGAGADSVRNKRRGRRRAGVVRGWGGGVLRRLLGGTRARLLVLAAAFAAVVAYFGRDALGVEVWWPWFRTHELGLGTRE